MKRYGWAIILAGVWGILLAVPGIAQVDNLDESEDTAEAEEEEEISFARSAVSKPNVSFNLKDNRDPMLSPDDVLLLKHREKMRLAAEEAERKRRADEERRRREEEERRRQWELMLIKDPTILVRNQIKISGLIDKEVLIGGKLYTVGHTYKGAKIVAVGADSVTFSYKGHKFVKKVNL